jgi:hypothetical protein
VIEWVPTVSVEVVADAAPDATVTAAPIWVAPSKNVTVPVAEEGTVAVNVTGCVNPDGFTDDTIEIVPVALLTTWV